MFYSYAKNWIQTLHIDDVPLCEFSPWSLGRFSPHSQYSSLWSYILYHEPWANAFAPRRRRVPLDGWVLKKTDFWCVSGKEPLWQILFLEFWWKTKVFVCCLMSHIGCYLLVWQMFHHPSGIFGVLGVGWTIGRVWHNKPQLGLIWFRTYNVFPVLWKFVSARQGHNQCRLGRGSVLNITVRNDAKKGTVRVSR